jgi:signal peptidase I
MAKGIARSAGIVIWILTGLLALLMAATFGPTLFGLQSLIVGSGSMGQAMPVGAVALTREVDARAISVGDIISYRRRGAPETTTHRVVGVKTEGDQVIFTTQGDANPAPDPEPVVVEGRIHFVEHVVPYAGYVARYARSPLGGLVLFVIPIIGLTIDRKGRRRPHKRTVSSEPGWSSTTLALLSAAGTVRSDPSG